MAITMVVLCMDPACWVLQTSFDLYYVLHWVCKNDDEELSFLKYLGFSTCKELLSTSCPFSLRIFLAFSPKSFWGLKYCTQSNLCLSLKSQRWHTCPQYWATLHNGHVFNVLKFMFSKKATKIDEIFTSDLTLCRKCQIERWRARQFLLTS